MTDPSQVPSSYDESKFVTFEGSPFQLYQLYPPTGDQLGAIRQLVEDIEDDLSYQTLLGVTSLGKTLTIANVIVQVGRPAIAFASNRTLAVQLYSESRELFPRNVAEYFVSHYDYYQPEAYVPQCGLFIEKDSSINEHIEQVRLSVIKNLLEHRDVMIVATVSTIYGIGNPSEYHQTILTLRAGDKVNQRDVIVRLIAMQYTHNEMDFQRGTFRVHGDTVDILPAEHAEMAMRLGLFDDEVESLQLFDPLAGRMRQKIPRFIAYPSSHYVAPRETVLRIIETIKAELCKRLDFFYRENKLVEAQWLEQHTHFDLEILQELGFCEGIESYSWHLSGSVPGEPSPMLVDYLPSDALTFLDESRVLIGQLNDMYNGDRAYKEVPAEYDPRLPSALDNRPPEPTEFETGVRQVTFVSATLGDYERKTVGTEIVEWVVRPTSLTDPIIEVRPVTTQVGDLLSEVRVHVEVGERVLVTTFTKHMAEQLTEFLPENGVKARCLYSDIDTVECVETICDLRLGTFDVLVGINPLREDLDIPKVSLVATLDADKEGFLHAERSLTQTIGHVTRDVNGTAILYADHVTDSMKKAIDETKHCRARQIAHSKTHGVAPRGVTKRIKNIIDGVYNVNDACVELKAAQKAAKYKDISEKQASEEIKRLERQMLDHAKDLEFEKAAAVYDRLTKLKSQLFGASGEDHIVPAT